MHLFHSFFEPLEARQLLASNASISGVVFNDLNSNGHRDAGEAGLSRVTVYLDKNNNKKLDAAEKSTTTDTAGNFGFSKLAAGSYIVRQIVPAGMSQTIPTHGYGIHLTLTSGQIIKNRFFGDVALATAEPFWNTFGGDAQHTS